MTNKADLNFLRFLTVVLPTGYEDVLLDPLFTPLSRGQLSSHLKNYSASRPLRLYVHVPFCATVCSFCHCHHIELKDKRALGPYVNLIEQQANLFSPLLGSCEVDALTVLGGTASLLNKEQIETVFKTLASRFSFVRQAVLAFEGHPSSFSEDKLAVLKDHGVQRILLGVQSLDEGVLRNINRFQTRKSVEACIKSLKKAGFEYINVDLVAGLPGQTTEGLIDDIKALAEWGVDLFNINPFSDIAAALCSRQANESLQDVLSRRNAMILEVKAALEALGFGNKDQRGYLKAAKGAQTGVAPDVCPGDIVGLGIFSKSNLSSRLVFEALPDSKDYSRDRYVGYIIDKTYSMAQYAMLHLLYGLDIKVFKRLFGQDFISVFKDETDFLEKEGIVRASREGYVFAGKRTLEGLFNYFAFVKILLGAPLIEDLRRHYHQKYNPAIRYGSKEDLLKVFQNFEFAREYYQLGKKTLWL